MNNKINVLSLFDGISAGQVALNRSSIDYNHYFASEIDKYAIKVTQSNYPNTIHVGDVIKLDVSVLPKIDLLIGGSPCQDLSFAGKQNGMSISNVKITTLEQYLDLKNNGVEFIGESYLFWEYVRILKEVKPKYFLLENTRMKQEWKNIISNALEVEPIEINSSKFVPISRQRLYWTNISNITEPKQVEYDIDDYMFDGFKGISTTCVRNKDGTRFMKSKKIFGCLTARYWSDVVGAGRPAVSLREGYYYDDKSIHRKLSVNECEKLQTFPIDYTSIVSKTQRYKSLGNSWNVETICHLFSFLKKDLENPDNVVIKFDKNKQLKLF